MDSEDKHTEEEEEEEEDEKEKSEEEDETIRQQKRMRLQYEGVDVKDLNQDKLFASLSEKSTVEPALKRFVRNGSLARIFASSPHIWELIQDAYNHSILLSKTYKARPMQVRQDASGNTKNTELEQLVKTVSVTQYYRDPDGDYGDEPRIEASLTIGTDPNHSIRFEIESGPHDSSAYVSFDMTHFDLQNATPDEYHEMITRWGLTTTV